MARRSCLAPASRSCPEPNRTERPTLRHTRLMGLRRRVALAALLVILLPCMPAGASAAHAAAPSATLHARPENDVGPAGRGAAAARIHRPAVPSTAVLNAGKAAAALGRAPTPGGS